MARSAASLVDVNVWLALLVKEHVHHVLAREWFETLAPRHAGLCRVVQLSLLRLLGNRMIMASGALSAGEAWNRIEELLQDERLKFHREPSGLDTLLPELLGYSSAAGNLIADAYLAAFAMGSDLQLVTFDHGFQRFRGLRLSMFNKA